MDKSIRSILENLNEEFVDSVMSGKGKYRELFVNPSKSEIMDLTEKGDYFRFVADSLNKKVYISNDDVFHYKIAMEIGLDKNDFIYHTFSGMCEYNGYLKVIDLAEALTMEDIERVKELREEVLNGDYDWMERYNFKLNYIKNQYRWID